MVDATQNLILINGENKTLQIEEIGRDDAGRFNVKYLGSSKVYRYGSEKVVWLTCSKQIDIAHNRIFIRQRRVYDLKGVFSFEYRGSTYWYVVYTSNYSQYLLDEELIIRTSCLSDGKSQSVFEYLKAVASTNILGKEEEKDNIGLLSKLYEKIDFIDDSSAIAPYLNPKKALKKDKSGRLIYPFGCNASQKRAVVCAFEHQISIIQGPPGTGKTTLAKVIAHTTSAAFEQINATVAGKKDMEDIVAKAKDNLGMYGKKTILFVDEIHRFNKGQQDYLLPYVEDGTLILIGATTENPYFEVNGALLSRSIIFELKPLEKEDIKKLIVRAVQDEKKGMGSFHAQIDEDALEFLADVANGDARSALNAVELGILTTAKSEDGKVHITLDTAQECIQKRVIRYDKTGDNHYDTISAFIKSMRGSDPDATAYYLARMLYAGEDVRFIARRILICASEDVGNADPQALVVASAAAQAVERLGMPEARITLSQAALYVACAPKSNAAYMAVDKAMEVVKTQKTAPIPAHLQDAHYKSAAKLGHGAGYLYAHDYKNHYVRQQYLPDALKDSRFYEMTEIGYEKKMKEHLDKIKAEVDSE